MKRRINPTCIATGGAKGTCKATCIQLVEERAKVAITDLDDKGGARLRDAITHLSMTNGGSTTILSFYGIVGAPDTPPCHGSNGAVREMSKTHPLHSAKDGVRINSAHPGSIWTPLVAAMADALDERADAFRAQLDGLHPLGRVGAPEDIAVCIAYLASDAATFVTGSERVIDSGYTAQ